MRRRRLEIIEGQLSLFDVGILPLNVLNPHSIDERLEALRHKDVYRYRVHTIKAGNMLECEIYPIWKAGEAKRAKSAAPSRKAQENLNRANAQKRVMRLVNENFTNADIWCTFGYDNANLPDTPKEALKDVVNFLRRVKNRRKKQGLPMIRYIYVIEWGEDGEKKRCHHHIIMSGDMDRDEIERIWRGGAYPQTRRLRVKEDSGLNGLGSYISKGHSGERMMGRSTNLREPLESVADQKITPRQAAKIAVDENAAPALFEKLYKGYAFTGVKVKTSEFVAGAYIYVQMHKAGGRGGGGLRLRR